MTRSWSSSSAPESSSVLMVVPASTPSRSLLGMPGSVGHEVPRPSPCCAQLGGTERPRGLARRRNQGDDERGVGDFLAHRCDEVLARWNAGVFSGAVEEVVQGPRGCSHAQQSVDELVNQVGICGRMTYEDSMHRRARLRWRRLASRGRIARATPASYSGGSSPMSALANARIACSTRARRSRSSRSSNTSGCPCWATSVLIASHRRDSPSQM